MKESFKVNNENISFRRATKEDNIKDMARLIYYTDPYIYPFWFSNNLAKAEEVLGKLILEEGSFFYVDNLYVAHDETKDRIIGLIVAVDESVNLDYDYSELKKVNHNFDFTITNYIEGLIKEIKEINDKEYLYLSNVCVEEGYRGKKIGAHLFGYFVSQMEKVGFNKFALDCLLHNLRAKNLYHSFGFKEMKEIVGFDGTDHSEVEVVSFLRKKGAYMPEEFSVQNDKLIKF